MYSLLITFLFIFLLYLSFVLVLFFSLVKISKAKQFLAWNWGAFMFSWIWGIANGVYIMLIALIPGVGFVMSIIGAIKGNQWLWETQKYSTPDELKKSQNSWNTVGVVFFIIINSIILLATLGGILYMKGI